MLLRALHAMSALSRHAAGGSRQQPAELDLDHPSNGGGAQARWWRVLWTLVSWDLGVVG